MPIRSNIPPKAGRLGSGAYNPASAGLVATAAIVGTVVAAGDPVLNLATSVAGSDVFGGHNTHQSINSNQQNPALSDLSWRKRTLVTAPSDRPQTHPNVNHYNYSTPPDAPALTTVDASQNTQLQTSTSKSTTGIMTGPATMVNVTRVQPNEKGKHWKTKIPQIAKTQFGAAGDKQSNTPFHPRPVKVAPRVQPHSSGDGERTSEPSFVSHTNNWYDPNNSFIDTAPNTVAGATGKGATQGTGRWHTVKRGAAG